MEPCERHRCVHTVENNRARQGPSAEEGGVGAVADVPMDTSGNTPWLEPLWYETEGDELVHSHDPPMFVRVQQPPP